ncbi:unnamed protein product [Ilex paraguariensis]|uniref:B box-type domain-containing protein n=1 Tax=Ilex paraguariensis TaxID=185542 RepID=A0ABC8RVV5_9AQUA
MVAHTKTQRTPSWNGITHHKPATDTREASSFALTCPFPILTSIAMGALKASHAPQLQKGTYFNEMKIQCDVCNKDEASVFCSADEAALCDACDHRVHHANKLAGKHQRFSLLQPSTEQVPLCDICQERRAFLFCQQDRAILCRECDIPIHKANEHTQKHNRFLLTGVKLSATSALYSSSSTSSAKASTTGSDAVPNLKPQNSINTPVSASPTVSNPPSVFKTTIAAAEIVEKGVSNPPSVFKTTIAAAEIVEKGGGINQFTGISEYLIEMLPGWHVEDFLDSSSNPYGFSKNMDDDVLPFWDAQIESSLGLFSPENAGIWVPQAPQPPQLSQSFPSSNMSFSWQMGTKESKEVAHIKSSRKWSTDDNCFTVPQISPPSTASKRARTLW